MRNNWQTFLYEIRVIFVAVYETIYEKWGKLYAVNDVWFTARHLKEMYGRSMRVWKSENI